MPSRTLALAFFATLALSSNALAQNMRRGARAPEPTYGSVERTRLLAQVRGGPTDGTVLLLGSVERRAILTGKRVQLPPNPARSRARSRF